MAQKDVLVIGAGPSGMAQVNTLAQQEGLNVRCFEMNNEIGGLWTWTEEVGECHGSMYRYHQTNGLNEFLEFENYSFKEHFGHLITSYPPRAVMLDYLQGWTRKMGGDKLITVNRKVHDVTYNEETAKFTVVSHDTKTDARFIDFFDNVTVCTGHFSVPNWPTPIKGIENYTGQVIHAHSFRDAQDYAGMDLMLVGNGYSGEDIAMQCVKFGAKSATIVYRTAPRDMGFEEKGWAISEKKGEGLQFDAASGEFHFGDGSSLKADAVIYCTGYLHTFPFLSGDLQLRTKNRLVPDMLWKGIVHPNNTALTFVGMPDQYYTFTMFYAQAHFVAAAILGKVDFPSKEEMLAHTAEWQEKEDVAHDSGDHAQHHQLQLAHTNDASQMAGFTLRDDGHLLCQWQADRDRDILKYRDCTAKSQVDGTTSLVYNVPWTMMFTDDKVSYLAWCKAQTEHLAKATPKLLSDYSDDNKVTQMLTERGFSPEIAAEKVPLYRTAAQKLANAGYPPETPATGFWVPGRIEVAGKHTDYAGGRSLLGAVSKGFCVVSVDRNDAVCNMYSNVDGKPVEAEIEMTPDTKQIQGDWSNYARTTIKRLVTNFGVDKGVDFAIGNDIPGASGMSTSSAVICAIFMVIDARNNLRGNAHFKKCFPTDDDLYGYLGNCENGQNYITKHINEKGEATVLVGDAGVGTFGGSEDHTAIMSSEPRKLKMFSYCTTRFEKQFDFPSNLVFVIGSSGYKAEKTVGAMADYNNAAFLAFAAAEAYEDAEKLGKPCNLAEAVLHARAKHKKEDVMAEMKAAIASVDLGKEYPRAYAQEKKFPAGLLADRFEQFYVESEQLVAQIGHAFHTNNMEILQKAVSESHRYTDSHLKNLVGPTRDLPTIAKDLGAHASSAFGAGFGGSCWAAVDKATASQFCADWKERYLAQLDEIDGGVVGVKLTAKEKENINSDALFFVMAPGPGAFQM